MVPLHQRIAFNLVCERVGDTEKSGDKYLLAWRRCDSKVPYGPILMSEEWSKY
jgi:hypothetical protein